MGHAGRAGYKIVSEETWAAVQAAYLRGVSAPVLAAHYGVTTDAIYKKAFREGWTRIAAARRMTPPEPLEAASGPEPAALIVAGLDRSLHRRLGRRPRSTSGGWRLRRWRGRRRCWRRGGWTRRPLT